MHTANEKFRNITHVIFDVDGLLLDTESLFAQVLKNIFKKEGRPFRSEYHRDILGCIPKVINKYFVETVGLDMTCEEFQAKKEEEMALIMPACELFAGAQRLVEHLHKQKIPIAVATSASMESFEMKTQNHKPLFKLFDHIVCGTDPEVQNGKPAPDIFLVCASRFPDKPKPEQCLVFEDSPNGVKGAVSAGMQVVMVPDKMLDRGLTKQATLVLESLADFKPQQFGLPPFV